MYKSLLVQGQICDRRGSCGLLRLPGSVVAAAPQTVLFHGAHLRGHNALHGVSSHFYVPSCFFLLCGPFKRFFFFFQNKAGVYMMQNTMGVCCLHPMIWNQKNFSPFATLDTWLQRQKNKSCSYFKASWIFLSSSLSMNDYFISVSRHHCRHCVNQ